MSAKIITIPEDLKGKTGAVAYWRLSGLVSRDHWVDAHTAAGYASSEIVRQCRPDTALHRALVRFASAQRGSAGLLVRKHPNGGYAIVSESREGGALSYDAGSRVSLGEYGLEFENVTPAMEMSIRAGFEIYSQHMTGSDVGGWLALYAMKQCNAVSLRDSGGFYFIPPAYLDRWRSVTQCLLSVSQHTLFELPAMAASDGVEAILDAIIEETKERIRLTRELLDSAPGKRAHQSALARLDRHLSKVRVYEDLLDRKMTELTSECSQLKCELTQALLAGEEECHAA
jgi:hypothetical protein